jgi:riboflavin synthase
VFTGIVREIGRIEAVREGRGRTFSVRAPGSAPGLSPGDSLAVEGVCLTVTEKREETVVLFASAETLQKTALPRLSRGDEVNLEPALRAGDPMGGHIVTGHVDGVAEVVSFPGGSESRILTLRPPEELLPEIVPRGSVAVSGVSLTVYEVRRPDFSCMLIPHTLSNTTLRFARPGRGVNIETDILAKYVAARTRGADPGSLTLEKLEHYGFLDHA